MRFLGRFLLLAFFVGAAPTFAADIYFSDCYWTPDADFSSIASLCDQAVDGTCRKCYYNPAGPPLCLDEACSATVPTTCAGAPGVQPTKGSVGNPWCLSPEIDNSDCTAAGIPLPCCTDVGTGTCAGRNASSFGNLTDGNAGTALATDAAAGDNIYLCAGACDGTGTATWPLSYRTTYSGGTCGTARVVLSPRATAGSFIQILPYCNGGSCEQVRLTADSNLDGTIDATEPSTFFANGGASGNGVNDIAYWRIDGDPLGISTYGSRFIQFDLWGNGTDQIQIMTDCTETGGGDADDDGVDHIEILNTDWSRLGSSTHWASGLFSSSCQEDLNGNYPGGGYWWKANDVGGPITVRGNYFYQWCGMITRWNNNPAASAVLTFDNNKAVYGYTLSNDHDFQGPFPPGSHFNYTRNWIEDAVGGISGENNASHWTITDNTIIVTGTRPLKYGNRAESMISINPGDTPRCDSPGEGGCYMDDIYIARNKLIYLNQGGNKIAKALIFQAKNDTGPFTRAIIENNIIAGISPYYNNTDIAGVGILVDTPTTGWMVRNNTLYGNQRGIVNGGIDENGDLIVGSGSTGTITGNLVVASADGELRVANGGLASTITYNNFRGSGSSLGTIVRLDAASYSCSQVPGSVGTNNLCQPAFFKNTGSDRTAWDLHLNGVQASLDSGSSGALNGYSAIADDFDGQPRPFNLYERGADEVTVMPFNHPSLATPQLPPFPSNGGRD